MIRARQLEYVLAVAECGSITGAAQELLVSQPALTKAIVNLEREYQVKLFVRTPRGVQLTPEGRRFVDHSRAVVASLDAMNEAFAPQEGTEKTALSIASQQLDFLYDLLLEFHDSFESSRLHLSLIECNRGEVINSVFSGRADIGLLIQTDSDSQLFSRSLEEKKLEATLLAESGIHVSCGPKSALYDYPSERVPVGQVKGETQLVLDLEGDVIRTLQFGAGQHHYTSDKLLFFNNASACIRFLQQTDATLYTPRWVTGFFEGTPIRTRAVDFGATNASPSAHLYWIKRLHEPLSAGETRFVEMLSLQVGDGNGEQR